MINISSNPYGSVQFGRWYRENDNLLESIEWLVLDSFDDGSWLLLTRDCVEVMPYNNEYADKTWENSSLRKWLNDEFYNQAFSTKEKENIFLAKLTIEDNKGYDTVDGNITEDRVFLLSVAEARKYFSKDILRRSLPTVYAAQKGKWGSEKPFRWWWLRSRRVPHQAARIRYNGEIDLCGRPVNDDSGAVRVAIRVKADFFRRNYFFLAQKNECEDNLEEAISCYGKAIECNQNKEISLKNLLGIYVDKGMLEDACGLLEKYKPYFAKSESKRIKKTEISDIHNEIFPFIYKKLYEINMDTEVSVGSFNEIKKEIETIRETDYPNEEQKMNIFFAEAQKIKRYLDSLFSKDKEKESDLKKERLSLIAEGSLSYAKHISHISYRDTSDVARYVYLQPIAIYSSIFNKIWYEAALRYIQTYFKIDKIEICVGNNNFKEIFFKNLEKLLNNNNQQIPNGLKLGIFELITHYNPEIRQEMLSIMSNCIDNTVDWGKEIDNYYEKLKSFLTLFKKVSCDLFKAGNSRSNNKIFYEILQNNILNDTDKGYVEAFEEFLKGIYHYNESIECDTKEETLIEANNKLKEEIISEIEKYPTRISYEKILPELYEIQRKIIEESKNLYAKMTPKIKIELKDEIVFKPESRCVSVPLSFFNSEGCQKAYVINLSVESTDVVCLNQCSISKFNINGGHHKNQTLQLQIINEKILSEQKFELKIDVKYEFKIDLISKKNGQTEKNIEVSIKNSSEFKEIDNIFESHIGQVIREAEMFYGRNKDIENIISQIIDKKGRLLAGRTIALYGQTRAGKSSLLYHLEQKLRENNKNIIVNIGSIGELEEINNTNFLYAILAEMRREINYKHTDVKKLMDDKNFELNPKMHRNSESSLNDDLKDFCSIIQHDNYNIIIMIDEFTYIYDWIRRGTMTDNFMKFWKAFMQNNNNVISIVVGQDHMGSFADDYPNEFGSTTLIKVDYLEEEYAKKLMYEPVMLTSNTGEKISRYKERTLDRLYELTAGSAYLIDYLNRIKSEYVTKDIIDGFLEQKIKDFEERLFEPLFDDKYNNEKSYSAMNKDLLKNIAQGTDKNDGWAVKSSVIGKKEQSIFDNLVSRGVVVEDKKNNKCKIKVVLYKEWILQKYGSKNKGAIYE